MNSILWRAFGIGLALVGLGATATAADESYRWEETATTLALRRGANVLWQFNAGPSDSKPNFHPLALADGTTLTQSRGPWHPWHRGAWFSWKYIKGPSGVANFWEENHQTGESHNPTVIKAVSFTPRPDYSAGIKLALEYVAKAKSELLLTESRTIEVGAPTANGDYTITSIHRFKAARDLTLTKNIYGGFAIRCKHGLPWTFLDPKGNKIEANMAYQNQPPEWAAPRAPWVAFVKTVAGPTGGLAILDHPTNPQHPPVWCVVPRMPYFNPVLTGAGDIPLPADAELTLRYRIVVFNDRPWQEFLSSQQDAFSQEKAVP